MKSISNPEGGPSLDSVLVHVCSMIAVTPAAWPEAKDNGTATSILWPVWKMLCVQTNTSIKMTEDWHQVSTGSSTKGIHLDFREDISSDSVRYSNGLSSATLHTCTEGGWHLFRTLNVHWSGKAANRSTPAAFDRSARRRVTARVWWKVYSFLILPLLLESCQSSVSTATTGSSLVSVHAVYSK